jgi:hypothetical protein
MWIVKFYRVQCLFRSIRVLSLIKVYFNFNKIAIQSVTSIRRWQHVCVMCLYIHISFVKKKKKGKWLKEEKKPWNLRRRYLARIYTLRGFANSLAWDVLASAGCFLGLVYIFHGCSQRHTAERDEFVSCQRPTYILRTICTPLLEDFIQTAAVAFLWRSQSIYILHLYT